MDTVIHASVCDIDRIVSRMPYFFICHGVGIRPPARRQIRQANKVRLETKVEDFMTLVVERLNDEWTH